MILLESDILLQKRIKNISGSRRAMPNGGPAKFLKITPA